MPLAEKITVHPPNVAAIEPEGVAAYQAVMTAIRVVRDRGTTMLVVQHGNEDLARIALSPAAASHLAALLTAAAP